MANKNTNKKNMNKGSKHQNMTITGSDNNEAFKLLKIFLILMVCFFIFYTITYYVTEKMNHSSEGNGAVSDRIASIQYDQILVGTMLKQKRDSYYVLLDKQSDQAHTLYSNLLATYAEKDKSLKVYTIDMDEPLNKNYFTDKSNITNNLENFKINKATFIKVEDGEIVNSYEGYDSILKQLKEMTK